jgi:fatty acid desaturase
MTMTTNTHNGRWSHRLGRGAGRVWRGYLRREQRVAGWLVTRGVPAGAATAVLWIAKLAVLGMLLYTVSWLVLLLAFAVVATWLVQHDDPDQEEPQPEWREGPNGFGLYDKSDWRIDPHVTDDD